MNATKIPMKTAVMTPAWAKRTLSADDEDVISGAFSTIACDGDEWFFAGPLGELLREMKIPQRIDIHYDLAKGSCYARLAYVKPAKGRAEASDGQNEDDTWRVLYTAFTEVGFALLWNEQPGIIHGLPSSRIALHLTPGDWRTAFVLAGDTPADLVFDEKSQKFVAERIPLGLVRHIIAGIEHEAFGLEPIPDLEAA